MHQAGFEYWVESLPESPVPEETHPNNRDWVAENGWGLVIGVMRSLSTQAEIEWPVSPNFEYQQTLSQAELQAYNVAMSGEPYLSEEGTPTANPNWEESGCIGWANHQIQLKSPDGLLTDQEFAPLWETIWEFKQTPIDDPELALADSEWANCMADNGYPDFERQGEVADYFAQAFNQVFSQRKYTDTSVPTELLELERELALLDFDCRIAVNYDSRRDAAVFAAETQFVNDHRSELEALRAAAEQRQ